MDVGGSMDPYTHLCERLFSAAHAANHFKKFEYRFFHNCVYERLYTDMQHYEGRADRARCSRSWITPGRSSSWAMPGWPPPS